MQSMQKSFGRLLRKGPGDNAKVSMLLNEYEDADKVLAQILDNSRLWRDSWVALLHSQFQMVTEYEALYDPIVGASDGLGRDTAPTPQLLLERTFKLKEEYGDLKTELLAEVAVIEDKILKPASDARDCIAPIRKTIKKRENKRIDFEKVQEKSMKLQRKPGRSVKEDAALAKLEDEMSRAADEFAIADEHLRETLPPIITASFSLIPPLIANVVLIQNRLLGLYYTTLNTYCEQYGFPSPPPPMSDVVATWEAAYNSARKQIESISMIARGKGLHQPLNLDADPRKNSASSQPPRRSSSGLIPSSTSGPQPRTMRIPSSASLREQPPSSEPGPLTRRPDYLAPTDFTTATILGGAAVDRSRNDISPGPSPSSSKARDYFESRDRPSASSSIRGRSPAGYTPTDTGFVKKKPPPPPPKRAEWVVALYTFTGEGRGDLSFQEGDRIKVVKKTGTDQDWWVGELNGVQGTFPANYCKQA
ncbi:protein hob1 [Echria macrotheca]|uniref:Protein hob1 n=1 Tax=Echria macrotheca TaxID=438768 RepID=A0AAJ0F8T2_9PEZI|nr:protein hob1 [Echria macrotheca]